MHYIPNFTALFSIAGPGRNRPENRLGICLIFLGVIGLSACGGGGGGAYDHLE